MAERLVHEAIDLALEGPWREWDEVQPEGTLAHFTIDDLIATGDPEITAVVALATQARDLGCALAMERV